MKGGIGLMDRNKGFILTSQTGCFRVCGCATFPGLAVIEVDLPEKEPEQKPPYCLPSMKVIRKRAKRFNVVSLFSGGGGSSLGYAMSGGNVLLASEFVEEARATYRANFPKTPILEADIREVSVEDILRAANLQPGELDILDGSPPCSAFSTAGKREQGWGKEKSYSTGKFQRVDDLFYEFVRILDGVRPKVFVAENVSGLVKGSAIGYFKRILAALKGCGYRVEAKLLDAQWLGVPQARSRIIFIGVRDDLELAPIYPAPLPYRYTLGDVLPGIIRIEEATGFNSKGKGTHRMLSAAELPAPSMLATRSVAIEAKVSFEGYAIEKEWERLKPGESSDKYLNLIKPRVDKPCPTVTAQGGINPGTAGVTHPIEKRKFTIDELKLICGFPTDFVLTGKYAQQYERLGRAVPPPMMAEIARAVYEGILCKIKK